MQHAVRQPTTPSTGHDQQPRRALLTRAIEHGAGLLPAQGPITAFVFLNTLQALEDLPFDEGVRRGARLFGCHPYMTEDRYREKLAAGRIRTADLSAVLGEDLAEHGEAQVCSLASRFEVRLAMLEHPLRIGPTEELRWFVAETDSLNRLRDETSPAVRERFISETKHWIMRELCIRLRRARSNRPSHGTLATARSWPMWLRDSTRRKSRNGPTGLGKRFRCKSLWRVCREGVQNIETFAPSSLAALRHRDYLLDATGEDSDALVHDVLIRFCAAFTDQGLAHWQLPHREEGFYRSFTALYGEAGGPPDRWLHGLAAELERIRAAGMSPLDSILESLELLGVVEDEWDDFIPATLLALARLGGHDPSDGDPRRSHGFGRAGQEPRRVSRRAVDPGANGADPRGSRSHALRRILVVVAGGDCRGARRATRVGHRAARLFGVSTGAGAGLVRA